MDEQEREIQDRISRRRMIKRLGAVTAVAWTAPVLSTLGSAAHAQFAPCYNADCVTPGPCPSPQFAAQCGDDPQNVDPCICLPAKGPQGQDTCFCHGCVLDCNNPVGMGFIPCTNSTQCPAGWGCILSCCSATEFQCLPPCGAGDPNCPPPAGARGVGTRASRA